MLKRSLKYGTIGTGGPFSGDYTGKGPGVRWGFLLVIITISLFFTAPAHAQRKTDIGFFTGVPWYMGDLSATLPVLHVVPPAIGPILRYNFNMRNALRAHAIFYDLSGSDENFRGGVAEFQSSFVDLGLDFEFNWWPYKTAHRKSKYTPYVSAGLGYSLNYTGESVSHLYLPFGGGMKANLGARLSGGIEVNMRKTFNDLIDGVANLGGEEVQSPVGNNDWYLFTGVFLTYKIFNYREECPTYD
ncbi:MAG: hypothetical protein KAR19_10795 [Bacteroidales bacterium]|nr:hypothetical protein [Bacteroidales bacterium]